MFQILFEKTQSRGICARCIETNDVTIPLFSTCVKWILTQSSLTLNYTFITLSVLYFIWFRSFDPSMPQNTLNILSIAVLQTLSCHTRLVHHFSKRNDTGLPLDSTTSNNEHKDGAQL